MFIKISKRKYKPNLKYNEKLDFSAWYFKLIKSYRNEQGYPRQKLVAYLGSIMVKGAYTEKYSKRIFLSNLKMKLKKLNISNIEKQLITKNILKIIPKTKVFKYSELPTNFDIFILRYGNYLKKHSLGELFNKIIPPMKQDVLKKEIKRLDKKREVDIEKAIKLANQKYFGINKLK